MSFTGTKHPEDYNRGDIFKYTDSQGDTYIIIILDSRQYVVLEVVNQVSKYPFRVGSTPTNIAPLIMTGQKIKMKYNKQTERWHQQD